ncbi:MAG: hypothetical protein JKY99_04695 [Rhizobiales bacterium]|nr:hypothetical protein [Hyphomicrobiales bacterium]
MDTEIDLEHIKSLKKFQRDTMGEFAKGHQVYFGRSVVSTSTEDPNIYMVYFPTRDGLEAYIVIVGQKSFAFGIEDRLERSLREKDPKGTTTVWINEILCDVYARSPTHGTYINFANQHSFSSAAERDVIVDLLEKLVVAMAEPDAAGEGTYLPQKVMFTEQAKKKLEAFDE